MIYTVVYVDDENTPVTYGRFATRERAEQVRERFERSLDADRDLAGGGVGSVWVCGIRRVRDWELDGGDS